MTTVRDTIKSAYRRSGIKAAGVTSFSALEYNIGIERLQGMFYEFVGNGLFGKFTEKRLDSATAYEAEEGQRVVNTAAATVTFPSSVTDAANGGYRAPLDGAVIVVVVAGSDPDIRVYDAMLASWQSIVGLSLNGTCPLTNRYDDHIKNMLAEKLADDIGMPVAENLRRDVARAKVALASRNDRERSTASGVYF